MSETTPFTIGEETFEIPILNFAAQRILLKGLPQAMTAFGGTADEAGQMITAPDPDQVVALFLETFAKNAEASHPILTQRYVEQALRGRAATEAFMQSMWALVTASGFPVGEMLATLTAGLLESPTSTSTDSSTDS